MENAEASKKIISRSLNKFYIALNLTPKVLFFFSKYITSQCHNIFAYKFHGSVIAFPFHIDIKRTLKSSWLLLDQTLPHCSAPHLLLWSLPTAPLGRSSPPATWRLIQCIKMWTCVRRMFLSDPGPIIVYPSQWLTHSLTDSLSHDLVEDLMNWPLLMESNI